MQSAIKAWKDTLRILSQSRNILLPFIIVGLVDIILLFIIYLAPQPPLSVILGPPIRVFWGERFLHYPLNLFLIPRLFDVAHTISTALTGVLMTGAAVRMLEDVHGGLRPDLGRGLTKSLRVYLNIFVIWLVMFGLVSAVFKLLPVIFKPKQGMASFLVLGAGFPISILIQTIFIYAIPAVVIEEKKIWPAIKRSASFCFGAFLPTLILVGLPTITYLPILILKGKLSLMASKILPEAILFFVGLGIIISVIMDCLVTSSTAVFFLNKRKSE